MNTRLRGLARVPAGPVGNAAALPLSLIALLLVLVFVLNPGTSYAESTPQPAAPLIQATSATQATQATQVIPESQPALAPVTVALIDSGVDYRHPQLPLEVLWRNPNETPNGRDDDGNGLIDDLIGWDFVNADNNPWDDHGHGTHLAGLIAVERSLTIDGKQQALGGSANARLMVLKVVDAAGGANGRDIARAIRYATDNNARVIQLSLGGEIPSAQERDALDYALDKGVLVIVAAGNRAESVSSSPSSLQADDAGISSKLFDPRLVVVGASDQQGQRAGFSNWGAALDLLAPGVDVLSLRAEGSDFLRRNGRSDYQSGSAVVAQQFYRATGTSFAAPQVCAVAVRLLGQQPQLNAQQLQRMLQQSARDLGPRGADQISGYGLLDRAAALRASPEYFVIAQLRAAELTADNRLQISGTTDANRFKQARIEYGYGEQPDSWQPLLPQPIAQPLRNQSLLRLDPQLLPKGRLMTLRLVTEHQDGSHRESRLQLQIPGPAL